MQYWQCISNVTVSTSRKERGPWINGSNLSLLDPPSRFSRKRLRASPSHSSRISSHPRMKVPRDGNRFFFGSELGKRCQMHFSHFPPSPPQLLSATTACYCIRKLCRKKLPFLRTCSIFKALQLSPRCVFCVVNHVFTIIQNEQYRKSNSRTLSLSCYMNGVLSSITNKRLKQTSITQ